eukprot:14724032-Alexandrium_andersonii.AAC.1
MPIAKIPPAQLLRKPVEANSVSVALCDACRYSKPPTAQPIWRHLRGSSAAIGWAGPWSKTHTAQPRSAVSGGRFCRCVRNVPTAEPHCAVPWQCLKPALPLQARTADNPSPNGAAPSEA